MMDKCTKCGHDPKDHFFEGIDPNLYKNRKNDRKLVREACVEHEQFYSSQKIKPIWKECCGILDYYLVTLKPSTWKRKYNKL